MKCLTNPRSGIPFGIDMKIKNEKRTFNKAAIHKLMKSLSNSFQQGEVATLPQANCVIKDIAADENEELIFSFGFAFLLGRPKNDKRHYQNIFCNQQITRLITIKKLMQLYQNFFILFSIGLVPTF